MRLKLTFLALAAFMLSTISTQAQSFAKDDNVVNLTIGIGNGTVGNSFGVAFAVSGERCFFDELINGDFSVGIGGYLGFSATKNQIGTFGTNYDYKYKTFGIGARGTFHWTGIEGLDTYAGVHIGAAFVSGSISGDEIFGVQYPDYDDGGRVLFAPVVGARYYFTETISGVVEVGSGLGFLNAGVGFKF